MQDTLLPTTIRIYHTCRYSCLLVLRRPKLNEKGKIMKTANELEAFVEKYTAIESAIDELREDRKALIADLKEKHNITPKLLRRAIRVAKIRTDVGDDITEFDHIVDQLEGVIK